MGTITLLTDFGTTDPFVGIMKGVILQVNPQARIVDISHDIAPQDVLQAAHEIAYSYRYFPEGTVHLVVVDPGVGSDRSVLALRVDTQTLLAPDNGALTRIIREHSHHEMVRVTNERYFRRPVSRTFHGRDIFAPVAAHLSKGLPLAEVGEPMQPSEAVVLPIHEPRLGSDGCLVGTITAIDRFGNLITDIDADTLGRFFPDADPRSVLFSVGNRAIAGVVETYAAVAPGELLAVIGSRGCVEFSVNSGNAAVMLGAGRGDRFTIRPGKSGPSAPV